MGYVCYDGSDGQEKLMCITIEQREAQGCTPGPSYMHAPGTRRSKASWVFYRLTQGLVIYEHGCGAVPDSLYCAANKHNNNLLNGRLLKS
jgi:hypothetical protein